MIGYVVARVLILCITLASAPGMAAEPVAYDVRFPNAVHHEAEIAVTFRDVTQPVLEVRMSRTSPGRYALHEFAKNVYGVRAVDGAGRTLTIARPDPHQWNISGHDGTVTFHYTLFGDRADGTYAAIDESHAHLNAPATFAWARGLENRPICVRFHPPEGLGWKIATQLAPTREPNLFCAPELEYFLDSPVELSNYSTREWNVSGQAFRLALHHQGSERDVDEYAGMLKKVVREQIAIFGELPEFDHGVYTFIACYLPWVNGDGMEHRNSTILTSRSELSVDAARVLVTAAHELFHAWNVERLRPRSLEPFRWDRENLTDELWFAEGFTSYYGNLTAKRTGAADLDRFLELVSNDLAAVLNVPARRHNSPVGMSRLAPFTDGARFPDPVNRANTFISYYDYGAVIALALDLSLRSGFDGVSLDDYMRALWKRFGRTETPYTMTDLEEELGRVTGDGAFAKRFFADHIRGSDLPDLKSLLANAGLELRTVDRNKGTLDVAGLQFEKGGAVIQSATKAGSPLYEAGLDRGARIIKLNGRSIRSSRDWDRQLRGKKPGDTIQVNFEQRGRSGVVTVKLAAARRVELAPFERARRRMSPMMQAFRSAWLESQGGGVGR